MNQFGQNVEGRKRLLMKLLAINPEDEIDYKYWNLALGRDMRRFDDDDDANINITSPQQS